MINFEEIEIIKEIGAGVNGTTYLVKYKNKDYSENGRRANIQKAMDIAYFLNEKETFNSNSEAIKIQKAMCYLTYKQKLVFNLKYFDQLSYDEISDLTQTSESALKTTYHHAIKKLEIYLNVLNQGGTKNEL